MKARNTPLADLPLGALAHANFHHRVLRRLLLMVVHLDTPVVVVGGEITRWTEELGAAFESLRKRGKDESRELCKHFEFSNPRRQNGALKNHAYVWV